MTWNNLLSVQETVKYTPMSANKTKFEQTAKIIALCGGWQKIKNSIEDFTVERFDRMLPKEEKALSVSWPSVEKCSLIRKDSSKWLLDTRQIRGYSRGQPCVSPAYSAT